MCVCLTVYCRRSAILRTTPAAFRNALKDTQAWAIETAERTQSSSQPASPLSPHLHDTGTAGAAATAQATAATGSTHQRTSSNASMPIDDWLTNALFPPDASPSTTQNPAAASTGEAATSTSTSVSASVPGTEAGDNSPRSDVKTDIQVQGPAPAPTQIPTQASEGGGGILGRFKQLRLAAFGSGTGATNTQQVNSKWHQDQKTEGDTVCLWASAAEVVPCISSNRRRPTRQQSIMSEFYSAVTMSAALLRDADGEGDDDDEDAPNSSSSKVGGLNLVTLSSTPTSSPKAPSQSVVQNTMFPAEESGKSVAGNSVAALLPPAAGDESQGPFYFGIDCRSVQERTLGMFPKAYCIDPMSIVDSDEVARLLETLEPLASSVHLCIIGKI